MPLKIVMQTAMQYKCHLCKFHHSKKVMSEPHWAYERFSFPPSAQAMVIPLRSQLLMKVEKLWQSPGAERSYSIVWHKVKPSTGMSGNSHSKRQSTQTWPSTVCPKSAYTSNMNNPLLNFLWALNWFLVQAEQLVNTRSLRWPLCRPQARLHAR